MVDCDRTRADLCEATLGLVYEDVVLDLETMGTGNNAAITAIGAVQFNAQGIGSRFYSPIDLEDSVKHGGVMDASTVLWWLKQSEEARKEFDRKGDPIKLALENFRDWFLVGSKLWGNGSDFDNVILRTAYERLEMRVPWNFRDNRCYRTMKEQHRDIMFEPHGTKHNAVHDAEAQALHLIKIWKTVRAGQQN